MMSVYQFCSAAAILAEQVKRGKEMIESERRKNVERLLQVLEQFAIWHNGASHMTQLGEPYETNGRAMRNRWANHMKQLGAPYNHLGEPYETIGRAMWNDWASHMTPNARGL